MHTMLSILRGAEHDPRLVAFARAVLLAAVDAACAAGVAYLAGPGAGLAFAPLGALALRAVEGVIDKRLAAQGPPPAR